MARDRQEKITVAAATSAGIAGLIGMIALWVTLFGNMG